MMVRTPLEELLVRVGRHAQGAQEVRREGVRGPQRRDPEEAIELHIFSTGSDHDETILFTRIMRFGISHCS